MNLTILVRHIGLQVRRRRTELGITQKQLAASANVSERLIRSLEMGLAEGVGLKKLASVLSVLGLSIAVGDEGASTLPNIPNATSHDEEYSQALAQAIASWQIS